MTQVFESVESSGSRHAGHSFPPQSRCARAVQPAWALPGPTDPPQLPRASQKSTRTPQEAPACVEAESKPELGKEFPDPEHVRGNEFIKSTEQKATASTAG